jgi:hypothetical protein
MSGADDILEIQMLPQRYADAVMRHDGASFRVHGCYNDEVIREDGRWKFKARRYSRLYQGPVDLSGEKFDYS